MARIRTIKPEFWQDEKVGRLSIPARLLFIGLWNFSDDTGVVRGHPAFLRSQLFSYDEDVSKTDIEKWIDEISLQGMITKFAVNNEDFLQINKFLKHQVINKPSKNKNPQPLQDDNKKDAETYYDTTGTLPECLMDTTGTLPEHSHMEVEVEVEVDKEKIKTKATACSEAEKNLASEPTDSRTENQQPDSDNHQQQPKAQAQTKSPTPQQADEPVVISIPLVCKKSGPQLEFNVTQAMVDDWAESFPAVDVPQKLREIRQWNLANPKKRKTKSGIVHHIVTWLTKEQNSGGNNGGKTSSGHFGRQQLNRPATPFVPIVSTGNKNLDISLTNAANFVQRRMAEAEGMVAHEA